MAWFIGVILSIVGSGLSNTGLNLQKYSFMKQGELEEALRVVYYKDWRWWFGTSLVVIGALGDFAALTFAPQSVIMPVGAFTLVCNVFLAHCWLKEKITKRDIVGTVLIVVGAILVAAFGSRGEKAYALDELIDLYLRWEILFYAFFIGSLLVFFRSTVRMAEFILKSQGPDSPKYKRILKLHPLSYAGLAGTFGAQSVMFAKSTAELLENSFNGNAQFDKPLSWLIVLCMLLTIFLQTHYLAMGLKYFDALYIVPVFQCFFITLSVLGGAVYFKELRNFSTLQWFMFPLGVLVIVMGVVFMSCRDMSGSTDEFSPSNVPYGRVASPDIKSNKELQLDHLFDPIIDPMFTPAADDDEMLHRTSSMGLTMLGAIPYVQVPASSRAHGQHVQMPEVTEQESARPAASVKPEEEVATV